jgi:hypothetical protein
MIDLNRWLPLNLFCILASHFKFSSDLLILEIIPLLTYLSYYQFKLLKCNMLLCNFFTIKSQNFLNFLTFEDYGLLFGQTVTKEIFRARHNRPREGPKS